MIDVESFLDHVNAAKPKGHGFTVGIDSPLVDIRPTWHYHEHVHTTGASAHTHEPEEFGTPSEDSRTRPTSWGRP